MDTGGRVLLVLRALGLGDFLTGVPAYRALHQAFPGHRLVLAAPGNLEPLAVLTGAVDEVLPRSGLAPLNYPYSPPDIAVNLHGKGPRSHRILLETRPRRLIAFGSPEVPASAEGPAWRPDEHEVARWARLLKESGVPCDRSALDLAVPRDRIDPSLAGVTIIHPGAAQAARRWPVARWAEVAGELSRRGERVVVTGGPEERARALRLAEMAGLPERDVLAGKTDLLTLALVVAGAGRVLCADTGVGHLATAVGTPSVVLFGPTSPRAWGPPPERLRHRAVWKGRLGNALADTPDRGLLEISVSDVLKELESLRAGSR